MLVRTLHGRRMGVRGGGGEKKEEGEEGGGKGEGRSSGGGGGRGRGRGRETSPYVALNQLVETQVMYARRNPRLWEFLWCM